MYLSERRPKPDVGNLSVEQAHAPLPLRAGHARMPPGLRFRGDRVLRIEVSTPHLPAFTGGVATLIARDRDRNRCLRTHAALIGLSYKIAEFAYQLLNGRNGQGLVASLKPIPDFLGDRRSSAYLDRTFPDNGGTPSSS